MASIGYLVVRDHFPIFIFRFFFINIYCSHEVHFKNANHLITLLNVMFFKS